MQNLTILSILHQMLKSKTTNLAGVFAFIEVSVDVILRSLWSTLSSEVCLPRDFVVAEN
jgi:hypothetical protein